MDPPNLREPGFSTAGNHAGSRAISWTVIARIIELKVTAAIMDAERDWSWIYRFASSMRARHKPADQSGIVWSISGGC